MSHNGNASWLRVLVIAVTVLACAGTIVVVMYALVFPQIGPSKSDAREALTSRLELVNGRLVRIDKHPNGNIERVSEWRIAADGMPMRHGIEKKMSKRGQLIEWIEWKNGHRDGPYIEYYASGEVKLKGNYRRNRPVGRWIWYNKDGLKEDERNFGEEHREGIEGKKEVE